MGRGTIRFSPSLPYASNCLPRGCCDSLFEGAERRRGAERRGGRREERWMQRGEVGVERRGEGDRKASEMLLL